MGKAGFIPLIPDPGGIFPHLPFPSPSKIFPGNSPGICPSEAEIPINPVAAPADPVGSTAPRKSGSGDLEPGIYLGEGQGSVLTGRESVKMRSKEFFQGGRPWHNSQESCCFPIPGMFKAGLEQPGILEWDKIPSHATHSWILGFLDCSQNLGTHLGYSCIPSRNSIPRHLQLWDTPSLIPRRNFAMAELHSQIPRSRIPAGKGGWGKEEFSLVFFPSIPSFLRPFPCATFPPLPNSSLIPEAAPDGRTLIRI